MNEGWTVSLLRRALWFSAGFLYGVMAGWRTWGRVE